MAGSGLKWYFPPVKVEVMMRNRRQSMMQAIFGAFFVILSAVFPAAAAAVPGAAHENYYLIAAGGDFVDVAELVRDAGGRVLESIPPDRVLASFADVSDALALSRDFRVRSAVPVVDQAGTWHVDGMDTEFVAGMRDAFVSPAVTAKRPPLARDVLHRERGTGHFVPLRAPAIPPDGIDFLPSVPAANVPVLPAWPMKNTVAVSIIMPESDGSTDTNRENWTTTLENKVEAEIKAGLTWWPQKASGYGVSLEFKFFTYKPSAQPDAVQTSYEPITHTSDEEGLWIADVMNNLGYTGYYTMAVDAFNTYMKNYADADTAVTVFVVNSSNDYDGSFPDGYFAYAHWGGPLIVMTTDNSSYGIDEMSNVIVHEMGHAFYATDEYYEPGYATCSCDDGYNGCKNRNCAAGCGMNVPCMMRYNEDALCADTVCHIGWVCQCSSGVCCDGCGYKPGSTICRKSAGDCDVTEFCSGSATTCPADKFRASSYKCRSSAGDCDVAEYCGGSSAACPADAVKGAGTVCRAAGGDCDIAENCTGTSGVCPANVFLDSTHVCRESGGDCDATEYCTGKSGSCPADNVGGSGAVCRESTGPCDAVEYCNTSTGECPTDKYAPATTVCRASTGVCDAPEYCTGDGSECPDDTLYRSDHECRPAVGACDVAEKCDGKTGTCPVDMIKGKNAECRAAAGACDAVEVCDGKSTRCPADMIYGAGMMCREPATDCDIAEFCTGSSVKCPANAAWVPGHSCDDGNVFTSNDKCSTEGDCIGIEDNSWWGCSASPGAGLPAGAALVILGAVVAAFGFARVRRGRRA